MVLRVFIGGKVQVFFEGLYFEVAREGCTVGFRFSYSGSSMGFLRVQMSQATYSDYILFLVHAGFLAVWVTILAGAGGRGEGHRLGQLLPGRAGKR